MYVFDTSAFIDLSQFYPKRFPSLWAAIENLITIGEIISVRESLEEIKARNDDLATWASKYKDIFQPATTDEALFIREIFKIEHFQQLVDNKKRTKGGYCADPFLIAKAKVLNGVVVTKEKFKPNSSKIPNVCKHFDVGCLDFEGFMEDQGLTF